MAAGDGLIQMTPSSISHSGTAASILADGGVSFTDVSSLSINGVFTSAYDNYLMVTTHGGSVTTSDIAFRMRVAGSDASGATDYRWQTMIASSTTLVCSLSSATSQGSLDICGNGRTGTHIHVYAPALALPTAMRSVNATDLNSGELIEYAPVHNVSTAYDGITLFQVTAGRTMTGTIHIFGYEE